MPPKNVHPSELWQTLCERPRPTTTIEFPTKSGVVGKTKLWILTEDELHACRKGAKEEAKLRCGDDSKPGDIAYEDVYRNELLVQLLCQACRAVEDVRVPVFPSAQAARKILVSDEWAALYESYATFRVESGPMISELTVSEMNAWIKVLQEGGSALPLARLGSAATSDLVMHLVSLLTNSSTDNGSSGSPPNESPQNPSEAKSDDPRLAEFDERLAVLEKLAPDRVTP